jgi:hypothetical protein
LCARLPNCTETSRARTGSGRFETRDDTARAALADQDRRGAPQHVVTPPVVPGPEPIGDLMFPYARWWTLGSLAVFLPSAWAYLRVRAAQRRRPTDLPTF